MARDYRRARRSSSPGKPAWVMFLSGFGLGLIAAFGVYISGGYPRGDGGDCDSVPLARGETPAARKEPEPESRFDFYTLLPEKEVEVPLDEPPARKSAPAAKPDSASRSQPRSTEPGRSVGRYLLQAGSFKHYSEADALKARLAFMGLNASIRKVKVGNNTYHRVRVGPFGSYAEAERAQRRLRQASIDSLLMKLAD